VINVFSQNFHKNFAHFLCKNRETDYVYHNYRLGSSKNDKNSGEFSVYPLFVNFAMMIPTAPARDSGLCRQGGAGRCSGLGLADPGKAARSVYRCIAFFRSPRKVRGGGLCRQDGLGTDWR